MKTEDHQDYTLEYDDSQKAKDRIFDMLLKWFKEMETFSGESIGQNDAPQIEAPNILTKVAEKGFRFQENWKE